MFVITLYRIKQTSASQSFLLKNAYLNDNSMIFSRNSMVDLEGKWEYKCKHYIFSPVTELLNLKQLNPINILWPGLCHQNWWTSVSVLICHWLRFLKKSSTTPNENR